MNDLIKYLGGIIVALLALLGYNYVKRRSAEALIDNQAALKEFNELDKKMAENEGLSGAEATKRVELKKQLEKELKEKDVSNEEIADFFNNRYSDNNE